MSASEESDDPNVVVIPVDDSLSDGNPETWPSNNAKWLYEEGDDTRWKEDLARLWVDTTGAREKGKRVEDLLCSDGRLRQIRVRR